MKQLLSPRPIAVTFPESNAEGSNHVDSMQTALFRRYTFLPEALYMASERAPTPSLSAVSAGCSIGAEADSLLALHRGEGYEGNLSVRGFDLNKLAIEAARNGLYKVLFHPHGDEATLEALRNLGFEASYAGPDTDEVGEVCDRVDVDAAPLREGYDVGFAEHDLLKPLPVEGADLILANNVLHKVPPPLSNTVVRNLCQALGDHGVLSVDAVSMTEGDPRTPGALRVLREEFDMVPLMMQQIASHSSPVIFGRA